MYRYDRRDSVRTAGVYQRPLVNLVRQIDKFDTVAKDGGLVTQALAALDVLAASIKQHGSSRPEGHDSPALYINELRHRLHGVQMAAKLVGQEYDSLNEFLLRQGFI